MNSRLRRFTALLLGVTLSAGMLAGCGSSSGNSAANTSTSAATNSGTAAQTEQTMSEPVNVVFWNLFNGGDATMGQQIFDEYNQKNPNVKIEFQQQDNAQYYTKLKTAIMAGTGPDFAMSHVGGFLSGMAEEGNILPLDELNTKYNSGIQFDKYTKSVMEAVKVDGKTYAVPMDNLVRVLMYNKALLKDTGLIGPDGNLVLDKGYDNFVKALDAVKAKNPSVSPLVINMGAAQHVLQWLTLYYQMGGVDFVDVNAKKVTFDEAKALEALKAYKNLYDNYVPPKLVSPAEFNLFKAKKAAFLIDGSWNVGAAAEALGDDFGVTVFPQLFEKEALATTNQAFIIPIKEGRTEAQEKEILTFIKYWGENNWKWSQAGHLPAYEPSAETPEFKALPYPKSYIDTMKIGIPLPIVPNINVHQAVEVNGPIQKAVLGMSTPEQAIKDVKANLENYMSKLN